MTSRIREISLRRIKIVRYAMQHNITEAAKKFGISLERVRQQIIAIVALLNNEYIDYITPSELIKYYPELIRSGILIYLRNGKTYKKRKAKK